MTPEASLLSGAIDAVDEAATMLGDESRRPSGPRGAGDKAAIDVEIERYLADRLTALLPARFVGEETPVRLGDGSPFCWLVDPHDDTWAWLQRYRGSAVSVALLRNGVPVLGVVCAPMSPDRGSGPSRSWAEGLPHLLRNGAEVRVDLSRAALTAGAIVFLHHRTAIAPIASGTAVAPARFVSLPSIAYRLARVAATVRVGGEDQPLGIAERRPDCPQRPRRAPPRGLVDHREAPVGLHRARLRRQVPHVTVAGKHPPAAPEKPPDSPRLGR